MTDDPKGPETPRAEELPEAQPPDSVHGVSIDLGPAPAPVEFARPPTQRPPPMLSPPAVAPTAPAAPVAPPKRQAFNPRLVVPLDLLDPSLPSSKEIDRQQREERKRRTRVGLMIAGGVFGGLLVGVITMLVLRKTAPEPLSPDIDVSFEVQSDPQGAAIFIDGKSTGLTTPSQLRSWDFTADHQLSLELKGYYPEKRKVAAGLDPKDLNIVLPHVAHLSATTQPVPAAVMVDGEPAGTTPAEVDLPADRDLKLVLRAAGFVPLARDLRLKPDEELHLDAILEPLAMIAVKSTPAGAKVSLDGAPAVLAPTELEVTAGTQHRIEARVPGLAAQTRILKVAAGKTQRLDLHFEDPRDRRARAELSRLRAREAMQRRKLSRSEQRHGDEYIGNARKLTEENSINDDLERIEAREQELEDELAEHDQELEDRIKVENIEASAAKAPTQPLPDNANPEAR